MVWSILVERVLGTTQLTRNHTEFLKHIGKRMENKLVKCSDFSKLLNINQQLKPKNCLFFHKISSLVEVNKKIVSQKKMTFTHGLMLDAMQNGIMFVNTMQHLEKDHLID